MLRTIPTSFDPQVVAAIDHRLEQIRASEHVSIPLAIESGSRAWGFPSPDSDYDSRFVFVRSLEDYLSPWPKRDVIETPLDGLLDVNGWDLRKALTLLMKGNAVILEWAQSPIQYGVDPWFKDSFLELAAQVASRPHVVRHYRHTADR
jgi:predicted nucleotidyltransferase